MVKMDIEADGHHNDAGLATSKLWTASNVFSVLAMGVGSIGYGYSANVIAPILGMILVRQVVDGIG
jgi:hypothetical protein